MTPLTHYNYTTDTCGDRHGGDSGEGGSGEGGSGEGGSGDRAS